MTRNDRELVCRDCGRTFIFRYDEQNYYAEQGYDDPVRCRHCRAARKAPPPPRQERARSGGPRDRELFPAVCAACGRRTMVPFKPREGGKPVYCRDCYGK